MCGRYSLTNTDQLRLRFDVAEPVSISADPNVAPSQELPVILESDGTRNAVLMRWGLIPHWSKGSGGEHYSMINARAETMATKPAYRVPFLRQRCLVPATGFFEWRKDGRRPTPHYIHLTREPLFAFAGLYDTWMDASGTPQRTFAIVTTRPNGLVAPIHDRMPVILHRVDEGRWHPCWSPTRPRRWTPTQSPRASTTQQSRTQHCCCQSLRSRRRNVPRWC